MNNPIVLFDGVCNLCNGLVNFLLKWDKPGVFRFAALQSEAGQELSKRFNLDTQSMNSFILVKDGRHFEKSEAALRVIRDMGWPFKALYPLIFLPRPVRDLGYDLIARNRYRIFGKRDACMMPTPEIRARFL